MHDSFVTLATRLIKKNGRAINLISFETTGPEYDPQTTEALTPVTAVQTDYQSNEIDGEVIVSGDKKYLIDSQFEIRNDMRIKDGGTDYSIVNIDEIKPGETSILYKVQARA